MPAEGIHLTALREAIACPGFPSEARACTTRYEGAARLGAIAPDLPYYDRYLGEVVRYVLGIRPRPSPLGGVVHEGGAIDITMSILERARSTRSDRLAALAIGLVSHCSMDRQLHPLVNALARAYPEGRGHDEAHREVEKLQSICFHDAYFGTSILSSPVVVRLVAVPALELFAEGDVLDALTIAFAEAGRVRGEPTPVSRSLIARMGRGYERHAVVLGSPLGARATSQKERAESAPRFLRGGWGTFDDVLMHAIRSSADAIARAWAYYSAVETDAEAARAALVTVLPSGTIDPPGHEVDLREPFCAWGGSNPDLRSPGWSPLRR